MMIIKTALVFMATAVVSLMLSSKVLIAQTRLITPTPSPTPSPEATPIPSPRPDITQKTQESIGPLEKLLNEQILGPMWPFNPVKYAIRASVSSGVPANTIVLLLLMPLVAALISAARHLIGLRGFGIFLPAAMGVVFVAIGPILGIGLFILIVAVSTSIRIALRKLKVKLQYLPRMSLMLLFVVFSVLLVLFAAPIIRQPDLANVSIFPVLILVLLAEDFSKVQLGKSAKVAINLSIETLILALLSYMALTLKGLQEFSLLNPELFLLSILVFDFAMGKYVGLRFMEFWRFRRLISD